MVMVMTMKRTMSMMMVTPEYDDCEDNNDNDDLKNATKITETAAARMTSLKTMVLFKQPRRL